MRSEEARLLAEWTPANLEAYGAALRADGDPRGELIALDLVIEREKSRALREALEEEKQQLQIQWLGEIGENVDTKFGFIEAVREEQEVLVDVIDTLAPFLRVLELWGDRAETEALCERFCTAARPWVHTIEVTSFRDTERPMIRAELGRKLISATPRLHTLQVRGHVTVDDFPHPSVEHVIADGWDALLALGGTCAMPNATSLDYAFHPATLIDREPPPEVIRGGLIMPAGFPKLVRLDVSRNEPRPDPIRPNCLAGATPLFDVLAKLAIVPQLEMLRVPSVRTASQAAQLQAACARMSVRCVEVARSYHPAFTGPTHFELPPPVSWLAGNEIRNVDAMVVQIGDEWVRGDLDDAYDVCEREYAEMTPEQRAGWDAVWDLMDRIRTNAQQVEPLSRAHLEAVLETIGTEEHYYWKDLAKKLPAHPGGPLSVRRINTFETPIEREPVKPRMHASSERIEEHERALQAHWDLERLAVYADDLQELGDVRGELIACDLKLAKGASSDLDFRRSELHDEIFGSDYSITSKLGFTVLDISLWGDEERGLQSISEEVMRYLGACEIAGGVQVVERQLEILLETRRPWLRTLAIETMGGGERSTCVSEELAALCPALESFELVMDERHRIFGDFIHPRVHELRITGGSALEELGEPWPSVTSLDFAFGIDAEVNDAAQVITAAKLPALRSLDLSRNERAYGMTERRRRQQCSFELYDLFGDFDDDLLANLVELKLPSPRRDVHVDVIQDVLERMPKLERLEIVRRYPRGPNVELEHPTAKLVVPPPSSWLPPDAIGPDVRLVIENVKIPLADTSLAMEDHYHLFSEAAQRAWDSVWALVEHAWFEIEAQVVYDAMDALRVANPYIYDWPEKITTALHGLAIAEKTIRIQRGNR